MRPPRHEVAEVFRTCQDELSTLHRASSAEWRVLSDLTACRTAVLGGHRLRCDACGHHEISYNSCRNRHCPKCQASKQAAWHEAQCAHLLEVPYFHIVFTLPQELGPVALQNKRTLYGLLFRAASETLTTIAGDPKHLGARIGFTAVLHTWGQTLVHHPHVHCVVPGGGLSPDGDRWIPARAQFFLPVRVLSRLFRKKYLAYLRQAYQKGALVFGGPLQELRDPHAWEAFLGPLSGVEWVVYAKPPFGSPEQVLKYLARYTHRVAISNARLVSVTSDHVSFRYKDYRKGSAKGVMRLTTAEFTRRFLLHVLPCAFVRIRHFGFLSNRSRKEKLALCRTLLGSTAPGQTDSAESESPAADEPPGDRCPVCQDGHMIVVTPLPPARAGPTGFDHD